MINPFFLVVLVSAVFLAHGCVTTDELYAQYDENACRVALEQNPNGDIVVREIAREEPRDNTMTWEPVIRFDLSQDLLSAESRERLDRDVAVLQRFSELRISVRGFTDASGARAFNAKLAVKRVQVVVDYLLSQGLPANRMDQVPLGEGLPLRLAEPEARVPVNRRVELMLLDINGNPLSYTVGNPHEY